MSGGQAERIYGMRALTRILTLTPRRIGQLRRLDLLRGDSGYTFRDLLALRAAGSLLDAGASVRQIRQALDALRRTNPGLQQPLAEIRLVLDGSRLLAQSDRVKFDPRTGQTVLDLDTPSLEEAAAATLVTGLVRPLAPPVEQAETWFERAASGTPTRRSGRTRLRRTGAWSPSTRPTRRPGTTWACSRIGWGGWTRPARPTSPRSTRTGPAARPCTTSARSQRTAAISTTPCAAIARPSTSRPTMPTPTSISPAPLPAAAAPTRRSPTGSATSSSTPAARGRGSPAPISKCSIRPAARPNEDPPRRLRRSRARARLEDRPESARRASVGGAGQPGDRQACAVSRSHAGRRRWPGRLRHWPRRRPGRHRTRDAAGGGSGRSPARARVGGLRPRRPCRGDRGLQGLRQGPHGPPRDSHRAIPDVR